MNAIKIEIDFKNETNRRTVTMSDVERFVKRMAILHPEREYYMDGDEYAIVSKPRQVI